MRAGGKISLLIVDDDANLRYLLEVAARSCGIFDPVATAVDGREAFERLQESADPDLPDFIVTDLAMPRLNGIEFVRAVKAEARLRSIPVAMITSSDVPHDRERALAAGVCAFAAKPHGLAALKHLLRELPGSGAERSVAQFT